MNNTDTPRTDEVMKQFNESSTGLLTYVNNLIPLAEKLEQELTQANKDKEELREALENLINATHGMGGDFDQVMMDAINKGQATLKKVGE